MFCRPRWEKQEKVLRVILQKTQSRRQGRECYEAIPPRSSCRQDQQPTMFTTGRQFHEPATMLTSERFISLLSTCSAEHAPHSHVQDTSSHPMTWSVQYSFRLTLSPVDLGGKLRFFALERDSVGIEGALPVDHTLTIKSVRAYKNKISIQFQSSFREQHTLMWGLKKFL